MNETTTTASHAAPHRTFTEAIEVCFAKYATLKGRASRSEFWWFELFLTLMSWGFTVAEAATRYSTGTGLATETDWVAIAWGMFAVLVILFPAICVSVRRLHDVGRSGWNLLFACTLIGMLPLIIWWARPGDSAKNRYDV